MSNKKVVILNGAGNGDDYLTSPFSLLTDLLEDAVADVRCYHLKDLKLAHCKGCMDCWLKTPGICMTADEGREIIQTIIQSGMIILFSPVTFGGYSSALKIIVDRFIPLVLPFLGQYFGDTHHTPRYSHYPRLVGIGIQRYPSKVENIISFFPKTEMKSFYNKQENARNALLIVGSPKIKERSTSDIFGEYLLEIMKSAGWKTEKLTLKGGLKREKGQELTQPKRSGPPVKHVIKALNKTGEALVKDIPIPSNIQNLISKPPIPLMTFGIWRWMFLKISRQSWKQQALENGISEEKMYAIPYGD